MDLAPGVVTTAETRRRVLRDDSAAGDDRNTVGERLRLIHVMRRQEHGLAEVPQARDHAPELTARARVKPRRRLI
jgi:hypothetical protein